MAGDEYARVYSWGHDPFRKVCMDIYLHSQNLKMRQFLTKYRVIMKPQVLVTTWTYLKLTSSQFLFDGLLTAVGLSDSTQLS